jgi:endonuclease/exonuclease/phosphatase family metal-dependent hydrolase
VQTSSSTSTAKPKPAKKAPPAPAKPLKFPRLQRLLFWGIAVQWIGIVLFYVALLVGEHNRLTMLVLYAPRQPVLAVAVLGLGLVRFVNPVRISVRATIAAQVAALLVVLFPIMGFCVGWSRSSTHPIKLASWNIYFGKMNRPELISEIAAFDADIILLQASYDSLRDMRDKFPGRHTDRTDDFVIVSKFKILNVFEPPPLADGELPKFVGYTLDTPDGHLHVFNIHPFSPRHALFEDQETRANLTHREAQFEAAVWAARNDGAPFIIVGDTNLPPGSGILRRHRGDLKDAFEEVGFGFGYTFPSKKIWMRIDRAFGSDGIRFLNMHVGPRGNSDHRPIFVDFEVDTHGG